MALDPYRREIPPATGVTPDWRAMITDFSASLGGIIPVANATDQAQLIADIQAAGGAIDAAHPLFTFRQDAAAGQETAYTIDAATWTTLATLPPVHTATISPVDGWTGTLTSTLLPGGIGVLIGGSFHPTSAITLTTNLIDLVTSTFPPDFQGTAQSDPYGQTPFFPAHVSGGGLNVDVNVALRATGGVQVRATSGTVPLSAPTILYVPATFFSK